MQPGDNVRLFLNISSNSDFPAYVDGTVITAVPTTRVVGFCVRTVTVYSFEYDSDLTGSILVPDDILQLECISCCDALGSRVAFLEADHVPIALAMAELPLLMGNLTLTGSISTAVTAFNTILFDELLPAGVNSLGIRRWSTDGVFSNSDGVTRILVETDENQPLPDAWIASATLGNGTSSTLWVSNASLAPQLATWSPVSGFGTLTVVNDSTGTFGLRPGQFIKTPQNGYLVNPDGTFEQVSGDVIPLPQVAFEPGTPSSGIVLYLQAGVLKVKNSSGIVKTVTLV